MLTTEFELYGILMFEAGLLCSDTMPQVQISEDVEAYAAQAHKLVDYVIESAIKKLEVQMEDREKTLDFIKLDLAK